MVFREWVLTRPRPGKPSISRCPRGSPPATPNFTSRAAVRCATPMPSPRKMITFLTGAPRALPLPRVPTTWMWVVTVTLPVESAKVAPRTCRPGLRMAWPRRLKPPQPGVLIPSVVELFCSPEVNEAGFPSMVRVAEKGPVPLPSTRMSKRWPSRKRAPSGGTRVTLEGAATATPAAARRSPAAREEAKRTVSMCGSLR